MYSVSRSPKFFTFTFITHPMAQWQWWRNDGQLFGRYHIRSGLSEAYCARLLAWSRVFKQALSVHHDHDHYINWSHHHDPPAHTHTHHRQFLTTEPIYDWGASSSELTHGITVKHTSPWWWKSSLVWSKRVYSYNLDVVRPPSPNPEGKRLKFGHFHPVLKDPDNV